MKTAKRREVLGTLLGLSAMAVLPKSSRGPVARLKQPAVARMRPMAYDINDTWKGVGQPWQDHCPYCCAICGNFGYPWWYDWLAGGPRTCSNCGQVFTAALHWNYVSMSWGGGDISNVVQYRPAGSSYLIYNEPNWRNIDPVTAADNYYNCYGAIRAIDATAQIGCAGVVGIGPDGRCTTGEWSVRHDNACWLWAFCERLRWKNNYTPGHNAYVHFWHVHAYRLEWMVEAWRRGGAMNVAGTEVTFERLRLHIQYVHGSIQGTFKEFVVPNAPVWITETSWLDGTPQQNQDLMAILWDWLNDWGFDEGFVDHVAWFSTRYPNHANTSLFQPDLQNLTPVGEDWQDLPCEECWL